MTSTTKNPVLCLFESSFFLVGKIDGGPSAANFFFGVLITILELDNKKQLTS